MLIEDKDSLIKKASLLRIKTRTLANSLQSGSFKSLYHGQGIEFSGVREYIRGDDVRAIDWNVTARSGRPFVKVFEEERELQIFLVVDCSLSMQMGSNGVSRLSKALEIASLLTLSAEHNSNPVGAVLFSGDIDFVCKPKSGPTQTMILLSNFDKCLEKNSRGSMLKNALTGAGKVLKKRSLIFVISDFRVKGFEESLSHLASKHDVVCVRISDALDEKLPEIGSLPFIDLESGIKKILPTSSKKFISSWREDSAMRQKRFEETCLKHGGYPLKISTSDDALNILTQFFSLREVQ